MNKRAVAYTRVSTLDQANEGISLDNQEAKIRAYAEVNDLDLREIIREEGASGKTLDREGMTRLLGMVEEGDVAAVIVYKLDRLSRRTIDTLNLIELFESKGVAFHSINEKIDTKSPSGRFFLTILSAMNQMVRDEIAEKTRDALSHKKTVGEWMGRIPYGFKVGQKRLVEDPREMLTIQKAKRLRRSGKSMRDISGALGLSLGYVHKILNVNMRTVKTHYLACSRGAGVQNTVG